MLLPTMMLAMVAVDGGSRTTDLNAVEIVINKVVHPRQGDAIVNGISKKFEINCRPGCNNIRSKFSDIYEFRGAPASGCESIPIIAIMKFIHENGVVSEVNVHSSGRLISRNNDCRILKYDVMVKIRKASDFRL